MKKKQVCNKFTEKKINFINDYAAATNAASGSQVDANANVTSKNIATLSAEIPKKDMIALNYAITCKYLKKKFGGKIAKQFLKDENSHIIYSHDSTSIMPYTYSSKEVVNVEYNGKLLLLSLDQLYDYVDAEEFLLDEEKNVYGKYPRNLKIRDRGGWTNVSRLIRKERHRDLVRVKTAFGEDIVVTDNHPIIIGDDVENTVEAIHGLGKSQYKYQELLNWNENYVLDLSAICNNHVLEKFDNYFTSQSAKNCKVYLSPNRVELTEELGYLIGYFIGDGNYNKNEYYSIQITQKDRKVLEKLANIAIKYFNAIPRILEKFDNGNSYNLTLYSPSLAITLREYFRIGEHAQRKTLPINILETNKKFANGIIWGLVDSDGCVRNGGFNIRISSRAGINQLCWILKDLGYTVGTTMQEAKIGIESQVQKGYNQNYTIWGIQSTVTSESLLCPYSFKASSVIVNDKGLKYKDGWVNITDVKVLQPGLFVDEQNEYIYDITTDSHSFICNNIWVHNCVAVSLYPFILDGLKPLGGTSGAPKHSDSFIGGLCNLIFLIAGQFAGAVAVPETLPYLDHFLRLDYGKDYVNRLDETIECFGNRRFTLRKKIEDLFQEFVYCVNQPAAARGYQSPFTNIAYFDKGYFDSIFKDFIFPDGDEPCWETTKELQKMFMKWFNKERTKDVLTFPVETMNLLWDKDTKQYVDKEMADFTAEMWAEGHSFFLYNSDSADALSSCCFSKDQKVLAKSTNRGVTKVYFDTFENIGKTENGPDRKQFEIFHNGSWCKGSKISLPNRQMYKIVTSNNKEIIVSDNHLNPTLNGNVATKDLTTDDYLMFNTRVLNSSPEQDLHLTYEQGFETGASLGKGIEVRLDMDCLLQSVEFRRGILDGWYNTSGGNTTSKEVCDCMEALFTSLGVSSVVYILEKFDGTSPLYSIHDIENERNMKDIYKVVNNSVYFKIKSIELVEYNDNIYCFEMDNEDEPYFTLPNGIITHNCRLKNAIEENAFSYTLGAGGIQTGSKKVITLNINRIVQDWYRKSHKTFGRYKGDLKEYVTEIVCRVHKYLEAWNDHLWDMYNSNLLTVYKAGYIDLDKQYLTIGFNSFIEGAEFLQTVDSDYNGIEIQPDNEQYKQYTKDILNTIKELNLAHKTEHLKFNTEQVPSLMWAH